MKHLNLNYSLNTPVGHFFRTVYWQYKSVFIIVCLSVSVFTSLFTSLSSVAGNPKKEYPGATQPEIDQTPLADKSNLNFRYGSGPAQKAGKKRAVSATAPRMKVTAFVYTGVVDRPEYNIQLADIQAMGQQLIDEYPEGLAIDDFRELTDKIRRYYRERGFILARAYVPEQSINDAQVAINILEGLLEDITLDGSDIYSIDTLRKLFANLIDRPIEYRSIESALLMAADSPGITFQALFSPGEEAGGSILKLSTTREKRVNTGVWLDNYGSEYTGRYRLRVASTINNLSGSADYLSFTLLKTLSPINSLYYALDYERPLNRWNSYLGFDISKNAFEVGQEFEELKIKGDSTALGFRLRKVYLRQRDRNVSASVALRLKSASSDQASTNIGEDKLTVVDMALQYSGDSAWLFRGTHSGEMRFSLGLPDVLGAMDSNGSGKSSRKGDNQERLGGDFSKINLRYTHQFVFRKNQVAKIQYRGQFSGDLLSSIEQTALGGPHSVRAYPVSEVLMDNSSIINVEWQARSAQIEDELTWLKIFQFGAYYDFATGTRNHALANERDTATLKGIGGFIEFQPFGKFQARFDLAFPKGGDEATNGDSFQLYVNLGRIF